MSKRMTENQIVAILKEAECGMSIKDICRKHSIGNSTFYKKLVLMDKHKKVAITAYMRKMITILNAMVRDNKAWCLD